MLGKRGVTQSVFPPRRTSSLKTECLPAQKIKSITS